MGWNDSGSSFAGKMMSSEQRNLIIMLRERCDGVSQGTYAGDSLPVWTKLEATREIDKLNEKLAGKLQKTGIPFHSKCPFCSSTKRPCCDKNPVKK